MGKRTCSNCSQTTGTVLRVLVSFNFAAALCLLVFGTTVERPINSFPPVAMILMAVLAVAAAITGLIGGHKWACCLDVFMVLHGLNTLCQIVLVGVLWGNFEGVVHAIDPKSTGRYSREKVIEVLKAAKWLMLLFMITQILALILSLLLRFVLEPPAQRYDNFDEQNLQEKTLGMQNLRTDVEAGNRFNKSNNDLYNKIKSKMASKYGQFTHGFKWKKSLWPFS